MFKIYNTCLFLVNPVLFGLKVLPVPTMTSGLCVFRGVSHVQGKNACERWASEELEWFHFGSLFQ